MSVSDLCKYGHWQTDDAPCRCLPGDKTQREWQEELDCHCRIGQVRQPTDSPVISTAMTVKEARAAKWADGQRKYGPVFVGDPLQELYAEQVDSLNYYEELDRRGLMTSRLRHCQSLTRMMAEMIREEAVL